MCLMFFIFCDANCGDVCVSMRMYICVCMYVYVYVHGYVYIFLFKKSFLTTIAYYKMLCCYCFDWNSGCLSRPEPIDIFKIVFSCLIFQY